jgi:hypothetical protein
MRKQFAFLCILASIFLMAATVFMAILAADLIIAYNHNQPIGSLTGATAQLEQIWLAIIVTFASAFGAWAYWDIKNGTINPER